MYPHSLQKGKQYNGPCHNSLDWKRAIILIVIFHKYNTENYGNINDNILTRK